MYKNNLIKKMYWIQFTLFVFSQLVFFNEDYIRGINVVLQFSLIAYLILDKYRFDLGNIYVNKFKDKDIIIMLSLGAIAILDLIIQKRINFHMIYWVLSYVVISNLDFSEDEMIKIFNTTCTIYFVLSLCINYTPLKEISIYASRELSTNKFIPSINRFIGLEGTPAGADILFILAMYINIFKNKYGNKIHKYILIVISAVVIIWTSSLSPLVAVIISMPIFILNKYKKKLCDLYIILLLVYNYIIAFIYNLSNENVMFFLNRITTWRAHLWADIIAVLNSDNSIIQWILGRKELIEVPHLQGILTNNPHSIGIFMLENLGIIAFIIINVLIIIKVLKIKESSVKFILVSMIVYMNTNTFPLTIRGNPVFIYMLIYYLIQKSKDGVKKYENSIYGTSS